MDRGAVQHGTPCDAAPVKPVRVGQVVFDHLGRAPHMGTHPQFILNPVKENADCPVTQARSSFQQGLQNRRQVKGRLADRFECLSRRGLLCKCFLRFGEEPHVFDGNGGLFRKGLGEVDMRLGRRDAVGPGQDDRAPDRAADRNRDTHNFTKTVLNRQLVVFVAGGLPVLDALDRTALHHSGRQGIRACRPRELRQIASQISLFKTGRGAVVLHPVFDAPHIAEFSATQLHRRCGDQIENRLHVARVLVDDAEDSSGGRLVRQRLLGLGELTRVVDCDDGVFGKVEFAGDVEPILAGGDETILGTPDADLMVIGGNNNLILTEAGDDTITARGTNQTVTTGDGNDIVSIGSGTVDAGDGDNFISASDGALVVTAGDGNDSVNLVQGNLVANLGEGDNHVYSGTGDDTIIAGAGDDIVHAGDGNNTLILGEGDNTVNSIVLGVGLSSIGQNTIYTGSGADTFILAPGSGVATIVNFDSSDRFKLAGLTPDFLRGIGFSDLTIAQDGDDTAISLTGTEDVLAVLQNVQADTVTSRNFGEGQTLTGTDEDDILIGSDADDLLDGLLGNDTYTGGTGADQFVLAIAQGVDTITDFELGIDQISLGGLTPEGVRTLEVGDDTLVLTNSRELIGVVQGVTGLDSSVFA